MWSATLPATYKLCSCSCHCRGVAPEDAIRTDTGKLRDFLRGGQEGWTTAYPKWDANSEIMPVPINRHLLRCLQSTHDTVGECYTCSVMHKP
jgi:hypothetical protein